MEIDLDEQDIWWIITQLDLYDVGKTSWDERVANKNQKLIRILQRAITTYPKKYLISPQL